MPARLSSHVDYQSNALASSLFLTVQMSLSDGLLHWWLCCQVSTKYTRGCRLLLFMLCSSAYTLLVCSRHSASQSAHQTLHLTI